MYLRNNYFQDFYKRAIEKVEDPFESFIYNWLAVIIGLTELVASNYRVPPRMKGDRDLIDLYLQKCDYDLANSVLKVELADSRTFLANRRGENFGHAIVDYSGVNQGGVLSECWKGNTKLEPEEQLKLFFYVGCNIRNNLFHGKKSFMDENDTELIKHMNRFLSSINSSIDNYLH